MPELELGIWTCGVMLDLFSSDHILHVLSPTARLCSNVGYAFVHMERKEEAMAAIDALNGTIFKGRQLAVELSKAQPLVNQLMMSGNSVGVLFFFFFSFFCFFFLCVGFETVLEIKTTETFDVIMLPALFFLAGGREGLLPRPAGSMEHHQSHAAVLAAAAAAAAGLPIQVGIK